MYIRGLCSQGGANVYRERLMFTGGVNVHRQGLMFTGRA